MRVYYFAPRVNITRRRQNKHTYTVTGKGNIYRKEGCSVKKWTNALVERWGLATSTGDNDLMEYWWGMHDALAAVAPLYKEADNEWLVITIVRTDWELPRWKLSLDAGHQAWENTLRGDLCSVCSARSGLLWILGLLCDGLLSSQLPHTYLASVIVSFSSVPILLLP